MSEDQTATPEIDEVQAAKAANRFDIRRLIGGLFVVYGVILVIIGLTGSSAVKHKAAGIDIDLWAGIGMLLFAAFMLGWAFTRPTVPQPERAG
jgi:NADH:ubiquinone oxidoreductase subunit 4 (subunit M)